MEAFPHSRLGFIYQNWCRQLFTHHPQYKILADEVAVQGEERTIGAIDFILRNETTKKVEHWEVAVKFYLYHNGEWLGPNAKDTLSRKLSHMLEQQLPLSKSSVFVESHPNWVPDSHHLLMQGRLYRNPHQQDLSWSHPSGLMVNPECVSGLWCYQHQAKGLELAPLDKKQWLIGHETKPNKYYPMLQHVLTRPMHGEDRNGDFWFVVPDGWPDSCEKIKP